MLESRMYFDHLRYCILHCWTVYDRCPSSCTSLVPKKSRLDSTAVAERQTKIPTTGQPENQTRRNVENSKISICSTKTTCFRFFCCIHNDSQFRWYVVLKPLREGPALQLMRINNRRFDLYSDLLKEQTLFVAKMNVRTRTFENIILE